MKCLPQGDNICQVARQLGGRVTANIVPRAISEKTCSLLQARETDRENLTGNLRQFAIFMFFQVECEKSATQ